MAKFEEVIAHLKDGGKVRVQGGLGNPELDLDALIRSYTTKDMFYNLDYIIIEKPYKDIWYSKPHETVYDALEHIIKHESFGNGDLYKITIEKIS